MTYRKQKRQIIKDLLTRSEILETDSGRIEFATDGKGPAVLISHGGGGGYDMGVWLGRVIGDGYFVIAPSRFGYLRTPLPDLSTPERQAVSFTHLLDALDINSAIIIGLSSGGPAALEFAHHHANRCRGLIMLSAISRSLPPLPFVLRMLYPVILRSDFIPWFIYGNWPDFVYRSNGVNPGMLREIKKDPEKVILLNKLFLSTFPASIRRQGMINDQRQCANLPDDFLESIHVPTLVIHAINDPIVPFEFGEFSAQNIPEAEFVILPEGGHFCTVTHQEVLIPRIRTFIDRYGK